MRNRRSTATAASTSIAALVAILLSPVSASAGGLNPNASVPLVQLECPDGKVLDISTIGNAGHMLHAPNGFVVGGAIAARWSTGAESGSLTVTDGAHAGEVITYSDSFAGPVGTEARRSAQPDLSRLVSCASIGDGSYAWAGALDQETIDYLGLAGDYLGAGYSIAGARTFAVYFSPGQLSHR